MGGFQSAKDPELRLRGCTGELPERSVLQVACASGEKQLSISRLLAGEPLLLPARCITEPLQVALLVKVAGASLPLPQGEQLRAALNSLDGQQRSLLLQLGNMETVQHTGRSPTDTTEAKEYLETHGVLQHMQSLIHKCVHDRPDA